MSSAAQGQSAPAAAATQPDVKCHFGAVVMISARVLAELDGTKQGPNVCRRGMLGRVVAWHCS